MKAKKNIYFVQPPDTCCRKDSALYNDVLNSGNILVLNKLFVKFSKS